MTQGSIFAALSAVDFIGEVDDIVKAIVEVEGSEATTYEALNEGSPKEYTKILNKLPKPRRDRRGGTKSVSD